MYTCNFAKITFAIFLLLVLGVNVKEGYVSGRDTFASQD